MLKLYLLLLFVCCLTLATVLDPQIQQWHEQQNSALSTGGTLIALLGDSRRMMAHEFFDKADAYFHSGFYPTIFDRNNPRAKSDLKEESHQKPNGAKEREEDTSFLGPPTDWIDRLGRHFYPSTHSHLSGGNEREILPWLKLAADLDPHELDPYLTASYWLRTSLNKPNEAEQFLRQALKSNPDSPELYLELGRINLYNRSNAVAGRNVLEIALRKWQSQSAAGKKMDDEVREEILGDIIRADRALNDENLELADLQALIEIAKGKDVLKQELAELKAKMAAGKK